MKKILLVDDDQRLGSLMTDFLHKEGFQVNVARDGDEMYRQIESNFFDLMILDITLPDRNGLDLCKELRIHRYTLPIIILTANGSDVDRINGLETGADDYITKPFNPKELLARVRAVLRRESGRLVELYQSEPIYICFGSFQLNLKSGVLLKSGKKVTLSSSEFSLLRLFLNEPNKPITRDQIMARIASKTYQPDQRSVDMLISRLRKRLGESDEPNEVIRTVRGVGYVFSKLVIFKSTDL